MKAIRKKSKLLPNRGALKELGRGQRTVMDYSKFTPVTAVTPPISTIRNLADPLKTVK